MSPLIPSGSAPNPVKGNLHLYDVDDALIHYVDGGDIGAYATPEEANAFIDAYIKKYLDPLAYKPKKTRKSKATEEEEEELPPLTKQAGGYAYAVDDFLIQAEQDMEEDAFNNRDKTW